MAQKKKDDNERSVDIEALDTPLKMSAHHLGFRARVSPNKIDRGLEDERWTQKWAATFAILIGAVTLLFAGLRVWGPEERHGSFLGIALFAGLWAFLSAVYARRSHGRVRDFLVLQAAVHQKLGR